MSRYLKIENLLIKECVYSNGNRFPKKSKNKSWKSIFWFPLISDNIQKTKVEPWQSILFSFTWVYKFKLLCMLFLDQRVANCISGFPAPEVFPKRKWNCDSSDSFLLKKVFSWKSRSTNHNTSSFPRITLSTLCSEVLACTLHCSCCSISLMERACSLSYLIVAIAE